MGREAVFWKRFAINWGRVRVANAGKVRSRVVVGVFCFLS